MSDERVKIGESLHYNEGAYEILLDGQRVGVVEKYRKTYNLRRFLVDEGWNVRLHGHPMFGGFRLRRHAMEAARKVLLDDEDSSKLGAHHG